MGYVIPIKGSKPGGNMNKSVYVEEIKRLTKILRAMHRDLTVNYLYAKHLEGRYYIHSRATKAQLEGLYEDIVNYISDNHLGI